MYFVAIIFYQKQRVIAINRHYVKCLNFNKFLFKSMTSNKKISLNSIYKKIYMYLYSKL